MKLGIRSSALLMILVPTLLPALVLSSWLTRERVNDARAELESRGERESMYLANASELALLVGDSETLKRLAESNLRSTGAAKAVLFLDPEGAVLAAAGSAWEVGLARQCWMHAADCSGGEQRYLFDRAVQANEFAEDAAAFAGAQRTGVANPQLIGLVVQSFDPHALATIQRAMLLKSLLITIAALLTIIGYSVNDTIVIFDRIREDGKLKRNIPFLEVCNIALNETLSRTIITSLTVLFTVAVLVIFGGGAIFDFALVMLLGVIAGTYSTVYIATPVMLFFRKEQRSTNASKPTAS